MNGQLLFNQLFCCERDCGIVKGGISGIYELVFKAFLRLLNFRFQSMTSVPKVSDVREEIFV